MEPSGVVESFAVIDCTARGMFIGFVGFLIDFFDLIGSEEAFHRCVVVAVAFAAHALKATKFFEPLPIGMASEL